TLNAWILQGAGLLAFLGALGAAALAGGGRTPRIRTAATALLFATAAFGQLFLYGRDAFPLTSPAEVLEVVEPGPIVRRLQEEREPGRVFRLGIQREVEAFTNRWAPFGVREAGGFAAMALERALAYTQADAGVWALRQYAAPDFLFEDALRRLSGVRFLVADRRFLKAREVELLGDRLSAPLEVEGDLALYAVDESLSRAFVVGRARTVPDGVAALSAMRSPEFRPDREALVEGASASPQDGGDFHAPARVTHEEWSRVEVDLPEIPAPGRLVLTDAHFPGWRATADGEAREIRRADHLFRAVEVRPGDRRVAFQYDPFSFRFGAFLTLSGLLGAFLLATAREIRHL
ncbi:MAG: hypothetical protein K8I02_09350, partial [Candidatus Methylomirabilis sp.]|nr:hypothetical protein [Deltaproteobacteria bacterium]